MPGKTLKSFGITVLDDRLGGIQETGCGVLIGDSGTGKSVASLQFLSEGLRRGGSAVLITPAEREDVVELARSVGINIESHLESGRCRLVTPANGPGAGGTLYAKEAFAELLALRRGDISLQRVAVDSCNALVESASTEIGGDLLVELLGYVHATTLLSVDADGPEDLDASYDSLLRAATLVLNVRRRASGQRVFEVLKDPRGIALSSPIPFEIIEGAGITPPRGEQQVVHPLAASPEVERRVLLLDLAKSFPPELRMSFYESFEFRYTQDPPEALLALSRAAFGLVAVHVDRYSITRGLHVMSQLRRVSRRPPILVMCNYTVRASDRAWALRAGADDFVSGGLHPEELTWRISSLMLRGRSPDERTPEPRAPTGEPVTSRPDDLRKLVRAQLSESGGTVFSLIVLRPAVGQAIDSLATHIAGQMRRNSGDRMSVLGDHIEVFLDGALASHAQRFLKRVKIEPYASVNCEVLTAPTDRSKLLEVLESQQV